jgi:gamma-glutamyl:cysteine ligase YbdK (ATP-grasp superfamily)
MGEEIETETFPAEDRRRFAERCREGLSALGALLERPGFGAGAPSIGVELEIGLIDDAAQPAPVNGAVRAAAGDPALDLELDRFNLELNSPSYALAGRPFSAAMDDLGAGLRGLAAAAAPLGARPLTIGILPTLRDEHLGPAAMSDSPRFRALGEGLLGLRGGPFAIRIDGPEPLDRAWDDLTLEGAATGLHVHLRVPPSAFAATFNAAQTAIAPILAASVNSPILLERLLWQAPRVALFAQAVDDRAPVSEEWLPSRAAFGHGWIGGPLEPFAESVALHVPLLPVLSGDEPMAAVAAGGVPGLYELRLHHGTVWRWNRAVIDPGDDPHLRIEMRALPAGPSWPDMRANVAYLVGLTMALAPQMEWMCRSMPFEFAKRNFRAAARDGLDAVLLWPSSEAPSPRPWPATELVTRLAPAARAGLTACGVAASEADDLLEVVVERVRRGATGAGWQRAALVSLEDAGATRRRALAEMTEAYLERSSTGAPVHEWDLPGTAE